MEEFEQHSDGQISFWNRLSRIMVVMILMAMTVAAAIWYLPEIQQNERMRKRILVLEQQIAREQEIARQNKLAVYALENDPKTIERAARERLWLARKGETIIRFSPAEEER